MEAWERERQRHQDEEEARRERARKREKKRERENAEKAVRLARSRRRRRLRGDRRKRRKAEVTGPAACPSCGSGERLYSIEHLTGYTRGVARIETGVAHFEREGETGLDWDSLVAAGLACDCGWRGGLDDLVLA